MESVLANPGASPVRDDRRRLGMSFALSGLAILLGAAPIAGAQTSALGPYQKPVSFKLNNTGRAIIMIVPIKDDVMSLGDVSVRIDPDDSVHVTKSDVLDRVGGTLNAAAVSRLRSLPEVNGVVRLSDLVMADLDLSFDRASMELRLMPTPDQRSGSAIAVSRRGRQERISSATAMPAIFAGYVNAFAGVDHVWEHGLGREAVTSGRLDLNGVFRMWNIVLETDAVVDGAIDTNICPTGARCVYDHEIGLKRQRSRLVYDAPDHLLRLQLGDADTSGTSLQQSPKVLGVALEKSPRKFRPGESLQPLGRNSFRLERPSEVHVLINGAIVQLLLLRPGVHSLADLPLAAGANDIQLLITDDLGERRTISFTTFLDSSMLGAGKSEWALSAGLPSYDRDNERHYLTDKHFATGFLRYGLTDQITGEVHAQSDGHVTMAGGAVALATPWGYWGAGGALSHADAGSGLAANGNWDLVNHRGLVGTWLDSRESLRLAAEYRSTQFRTPGEFLTTASGILYPQFNYWLRLTGSYSIPVAWGATAVLSARYQFADDKRPAVSAFAIEGDRYGADLTLSAPLNSWTTGSLTIGYSNERYLRYVANPTHESDPELRAMARLFVRPAERTFISASYDNLDRVGSFSASRIVGRGLDRWETNVTVQHAGVIDQASANGNITYHGNRFEGRASHYTGYPSIALERIGSGRTDQRSSVQVGAAIAVADGKVGIGQPIRGQAFAVVSPHDSLAGKQILVGEAGHVRARADGLGNAVVADLPAYAPGRVPIDVPDAPLGYSLGAGGFDTHAPYRGGYAFEVGSAFSVSAYGTLLQADGEPVALLTGSAYPIDNPAKRVAVFTNKTGRFGAEGLAPGRWIVEMATEGAPTRFEITIPKGTDGVFKAGVLKPMGGG